MDRVTDADELLDGPLDDPKALAGNLRDLRRINRALGGVRLSRLAVDRLLNAAPTHMDASPISIIDVGTGGADIPVALLADARRRGRALEVVAVDARPEVVEAARASRPALASVPGLALDVSDGRSLPHPDRAFDIAHASLLVHHFSPDEAVALLAEMARVARLGIVVNDLDRGRVHWLGAWLIAHLFTMNRYTRRDAPLSVRRAYTPREMRELLARAGLRPVGEFGGFVGHRYAFAAIRGVTVDVAIVGGGPAGAILAARLARRGRAVVLLERSAGYRWRACGVFSSPASVHELRMAGLDADALAAVVRPSPAMRVETATGTRIRLTYGDDGRLAAPAVSFDRATLDPALIVLARRAGADVRLGASATGVGPGRIVVRGDAGEIELEARVIVGADGIRSTVARAFGVGRTPLLGDRVGLTFHVADPGLTAPRDARMILFRDGYVGLAPVPGKRVNVGIVLGRSWANRLRADGAERTVESVLAAIPPADDDPVDWRAAERCDPIEGAAPLGHRVARRHGRGWLLVGDAAGFLDPFTGEGLHRALVSARLAAAAIEHDLDGVSDGLAGYDGAMTARFRSKDVLSLLVQAFLARPALFDYAARRLAGRPRVRETMGLVMGDLVPASRALDPRFVASLLRP